MDPTAFIGIDVSKDHLDVHVHPDGGAFRLARSGDGVAALIERLGRLRPALVALEATGGFEMVAAAGLAAAGLPVVVVNPAQVRSFALALGKRAKTDPIDAAVIAPSPPRRGRRCARCRTRTPSSSPIWSPAAARSSP